MSTESEKKTSGFTVGNKNRERNNYLMKCMFRYAAKCRDSMEQRQTELASAIGVSQSTISRWESWTSWDNTNNNKSFPTFLQILQICTALGLSIDDTLQGAVEIMEDDKKESAEVPDSLDVVSSYLQAQKMSSSYLEDENYDHSKLHLDRLDVFKNKKYVAFYLPPTVARQRAREVKRSLDSLHICTSDVDKRGFCPFTMRINNNKNLNYSGKIVSPPNNCYAYFYLNGGALPERGLGILYYPPTLGSGRYICGTGVLLSIDRYTRNPSFQRMILLEQRLYKKDKIGKYIESLLNEPFTKSEYPVMDVDALQEKHDDLYAMISSHARLR